jgi:Protein of unknown function (DUF2851)
VGETLWAGNIELHVKSSDWEKHAHSTDTQYGNIILHVVWQHDSTVKLPFPTLVLADRVPKILLKRYAELMKHTHFIPCGKRIGEVNELVWKTWKASLLAGRLQSKADKALQLLKQKNFHWEDTFWQMIAHNFGARQNSAAFEAIAQTISINILAKHKNQIQQVEALLLWQAGLLENDFTETYPQLLKKEYHFLKKKYKLLQPPLQLQYLRMRPANFPTVRLAQMAMLIHNSLHLFSKILETEELAVIKKLLTVTANDYWHYHYTLDDPTGYKIKKLGMQMTENIIINTIAPMLFAYGAYHANDFQKEKAIAWLEQIKAEKNTLVKGFDALGIKAHNAFDTQALVELKNKYCAAKRCLDCAVGNTLLKDAG